MCVWVSVCLCLSVGYAKRPRAAAIFNCYAPCVAASSPQLGTSVANKEQTNLYFHQPSPQVRRQLAEFVSTSQNPNSNWPYESIFMPFLYLLPCFTHPFLLIFSAVFRLAAPAFHVTPPMCLETRQNSSLRIAFLASKAVFLLHPTPLHFRLPPLISTHYYPHTPLRLFYLIRSHIHPTGAPYN